MRVGRKRVARLMRTAGLVGCHRRRHPQGLTRRDPQAAPAPDLCQRQFSPPWPDRRWHADSTELPTDQGPLYLVAVVDGCSRLAVGYAMGEHATAELAIAAVELAVSRRQVDPDDGLVHHSDQGSQFTSLAFGSKLREVGIRQSMGSVGDCFDHALIESFFATLECELIDWRHWRTREEARLEVFWWLEAVYNRTRRHSSLGYLSPMEYEAKLSMAATNSNPSK